MSRFPPAISRLITAFSHLPNLGPKTAERISFALLKKSQKDLDEFADALRDLKKGVTVCATCQNFATSSPCDICRDSRRDRALLCVVARPVDVAAIEKTGVYRGLYHVLGGVLNPLQGIMPEHLTVKQLLGRLQNKKSVFKEILVATNTDLDGENTALFLAKALKPYKLRVTRLARGLPMGSDLEYADEITLESALEGRREMK